jgi:SAM-dependent methyltransferase
MLTTILLNPERIRQRYNELGYAFRPLLSCNRGLDEAFRALHREGGNRFLDIGCGPGRHTEHYLPGAHYTAVDYAETAILQAQEELKQRLKHNETWKANPPTLEWVSADAQRHTYDGQFDGALFAYVLTAMARPEEAVRHASSAVRRGGNIVILDYITEERSAWDTLRVVTAIRRNLANPYRTIKQLIGESPLSLQDKMMIPRPPYHFAGFPPTNLYIFSKLETIFI